MSDDIELSVSIPAPQNVESVVRQRFQPQANILDGTLDDLEPEIEIEELSFSGIVNFILEIQHNDFLLWVMFVLIIVISIDCFFGIIKTNFVFILWFIISIICGFYLSARRINADRTKGRHSFESFFYNCFVIIILGIYICIAALPVLAHYK